MKIGEDMPENDMAPLNIPDFDTLRQAFRREMCNMCREGLPFSDDREIAHKLLKPLRGVPHRPCKAWPAIRYLDKAVANRGREGQGGAALTAGEEVFLRAVIVDPNVRTAHRTAELRLPHGGTQPIYADLLDVFPVKIKMDSKLRAALASRVPEADVRRLARKVLPCVSGFCATTPKWFKDGVEQDPLGGHALLQELLALAANPSVPPSEDK